MSKRKASKKQRPSIASQHNLSKRKYEQLKREAENTRRRIKEFSKKPEAESYTLLPDAEDYKLTNLLRRIDDGQKVNAILKEMAKINFKNLKTDQQPYYNTKYGYHLSKKDRDRALRALNKANKNIDEARNKFNDFVNILPERFNVSDTINNLSSDSALNNLLKGLRGYTKQNLVPEFINNIAGTKAEYNMLSDVIERENKRRKEKKDQGPPTEGYLKLQSDYDSKPIDINKLLDIQSLRRRASQWNDSALVERANTYISRYTTQLERVQAEFIDNMIYNESIANKFKLMYEVLDRIINNVDAITYMSTRMPEMDISIISDRLVGAVEFNGIYNDFVKFKGYLDSGYFSG